MRVALTGLLSLVGTSALAHAGHLAEAGGHSHVAFYAGLCAILIASLIIAARRRLAGMKSDT